MVHHKPVVGFENELDGGVINLDSSSNVRELPKSPELSFSRLQQFFVHNVEEVYPANHAVCLDGAKDVFSRRHLNFGTPIRRSGMYRNIFSCGDSIFTRGISIRQSKGVVFVSSLFV